MPSSEYFSLRVPGSTSNLGSGFDTISAALRLYLKLRIARSPGERDVQWVADWDISPEENMISIAFETACRAFGIRPQGLRIEVDNEIPLQRGLGSSAAAIVAGVKIAERLAGKTLEPDEIFEIAYPLEGHPDNLSASLLGGWVISRVADGRMYAERLSSALNCRFVLAVPEVCISTQTAREILPERLGLADAVFNLQRCALLVHAISTGRAELLREATRDRLHQSFRASLVPGVPALLEQNDLSENLTESLVSVTVSGSGSSVLAITNDHSEEIGEWMLSVLEREGTTAGLITLDLDETGARFL